MMYELNNEGMKAGASAEGSTHDPPAQGSGNIYLAAMQI